jgi:methionyl-tRNA formyltransferase
MVRFVLIGEGRPARALLDVMINTPGASIDALVVEQPARNPLAEFACRRGIRVVDKSDLTAACRQLTDSPDGWLISANSTLIIPPAVLDVFDGRSLNLHPGLLPEYAGLHTHQWAIRNGEREFGVTVHRIERMVDGGAIVGQRRFPIRPEDTGLSLFSRCLAVGAELLSHVVAQIIRGEALTDSPQDLTRRHLYRQRDALEHRIDWNASAKSVIDFIRAGNYEPFASPTYVATLDRLADFNIEVLRATAEGASTMHPGTIVDVEAAGPLIACGNGGTIRIVKARFGRQAMSLEGWHEYVSHLPGRRLRGREFRSEAESSLSRKSQSIISGQ